MKIKKQEIILSQEVAPLSELKNMITKNIFPLCIYLNDKEKKEFRNNRKNEINNLIRELYPIFNLNNYLYLSGTVLRKKIENGEVYVNKFIDNSKKLKNIRYIAPAFECDLNCPKIIFRKTPRLFLKTIDHFLPNDKYEGEEILGLCWNLALADKEQKRLLKKITDNNYKEVKTG